MKRRILSALLALGLLLSLAACGAGGGAAAAEGQSNKSLTVVTTLFPAYDFARELCGGRCEIVLLVPPGAETHSYEPTPQDLLRIQSCDLLICNGGESEAWLDTLLDGADGAFAVLSMLDCVDALEEEHKEGMQRIREENTSGPRRATPPSSAARSAGSSARSTRRERKSTAGTARATARSSTSSTRPSAASSPRRAETA